MQDSKILKKMRKRVIKNFMDIIILGELVGNPLKWI